MVADVGDAPDGTPDETPEGASSETPEGAPDGTLTDALSGRFRVAEAVLLGSDIAAVLLEKRSDAWGAPRTSGQSARMSPGCADGR